ncbi:ImmA/IrrE family metallo-endopeptidase [Mesorhizobium abyssinicae]|uniref:ImmA/IrrE family metallo-endopeptidase n=1 Tax=Mesorhizobium abyssinicae TaxID=1209958 RepID=A0ABU5AMM6_9HYPH|nr:ImmA/IrrE family metallo-endopeptidase [Mesorhizobium abyssinicae]MDX8538555.1 ImmA/IrrE family metallo-endopeptidase [Mesorhizobium abyssinicae]
MTETLDTLRRYTATAPVDVVAIARGLGLDVFPAAFDDQISGMIQRNTDGATYSILVNANDTPERQRFTIAHEIGHYLYHRDLIGDGVADSPAYRAPDTSIYGGTRLQQRHETQANQFAANILMPLDLIRSIEAREPGITLPELARRLRVSLPALRVRKGLTPYPNANEEFGMVDLD